MTSELKNLQKKVHVEIQWLWCPWQPFNKNDKKDLKALFLESLVKEYK